jgi:anti-anti-sigma factor
MANLMAFEEHLEGDDVHIRLEGELDHFAVPEVRKQMLQAVDLGPGAVHLDLRGVSFIGSPGLNLMAKVAKRLCSEQRLMTCVINQRLASIFRMCSLASLLNVRVDE